MPKSNAARIAIVHPASTSRIERAAQELDAIRKQLADLNVRKDELSARLLLLTKAEGEADDAGKVRYETDAHKFVVIPGKNVYVDPKKLMIALTSIGITPKVQRKVRAACVKETDYEYVGVYVKKQDEGAA
jgi:hypothetical protein